MKGKTHMLIGAAVGASTMSHYSTEGGLLLLGASIFGSLIPDLDHPKSFINQRILPVKNKVFKIMVYLLIGCIFLSLESAYHVSTYRILGLAFILTGLSHHRSFTHSIFGLAMFSGAIYLAMLKYNLMVVTVGFIVGYSSHLVSDFITKDGIEFFYPVKRNFRSPVTIRTGGGVESIISIGAGCTLLYWLFFSKVVTI